MKMINTRLTNKPSRKERPRSAEKGIKGARKSRDAGTPEKNGSPVVFAQDESEAESPAAILQIPTDYDTQQFIINEDDMKHRRKPHPPYIGKATKKVMVRKQSEEDAQTDNVRKRRILVAKRISDESELQAVGTAVDVSGEEEDIIKPHTILGSVVDFEDEMQKRGMKIKKERTFNWKSNIQFNEDQKPQQITMKEVLKKDANMNEVNALENWEKRMKERRQQQDYLLKKTNKETNDLLMGISDVYREIQQEREAIHRAIPSVDYGKGYRVGSEFWKQVETIGGEEIGICMTLTETEKGFPPPIEQIGKPSTVLRETIGFSERLKNVTAYYPWWKSSYLKKRKGELQKALNVLVPHQPYIDELEVIGHNAQETYLKQGDNNYVNTEADSTDSTAADIGELNEKEDPFSAYADVFPLPVFGPSLVMNGQPLQWTGTDTKPRNEKGAIITLPFQSPIDENSLNALDVTNNGTAAIYYSWRFERPVDPFKLKKGRPIQRFYFDIRSGVILPGDNLKVRFSFKSPNSGMFTEVWIFETQPILCGGAQVQVILTGIATREDTYIEKRAQLEKAIAKKEALRAVDRILIDLLSGVRTPPRPSTPIDAYITEKEIFERMNDKLLYDNEIVTQLSTLYSDVTGGKMWNMSINEIIKAIKIMEDEEQIETSFETLNSYLGKMTKRKVPPKDRAVYSASYQLLCDAIDCFCHEASILQTTLGMPERDFMVEQPQEEVVKKSKRTGEKIPDKRQDTKKDRKETMSPIKGKVTSSSKSRSKDPVSSKSDIPETDPKAPDAESIQGPTSPKYKEKLYTILYGILLETMEKMEEMALPTQEISADT